MQIIFLSGTKYLWLAQYVNKFLVRLKKFGPAQNILGPVTGQGIKSQNLLLGGLFKNYIDKILARFCVGVIKGRS